MVCSSAAPSPSKVRDGGAPVLDVEVRGAVGRRLRTIAVEHAELDDAVGLVERQVAQQRAVDEGEHDHVHRDAQRQRQHRGEGEPAILQEQATAVRDVGPECHLVSALSSKARPAPRLGGANAYVGSMKPSRRRMTRLP